MTDLEQQGDELRHIVEEQTALRRVATLVAAGASEVDLVAAVTTEIATLFGAHAANTMRWDGDTIRVIGDWRINDSMTSYAGRVFSFGGDTITARVVHSALPSRIDSSADLETDFARERWEELGLEASIGAPIIVDGTLWGVITASRTTPDDPFPLGAEHRLGDFAALVAQAIANAEARREITALAEEQAALRRVATLVAGGRPQAEVIEAVTREVGELYGAHAVNLVRWEGVQDEVVVVGGWSDGTEPAVSVGSPYHPKPGSATLTVLETGFPSRTDETSLELGERHVIAAPVIVNARLLGALTALRPPSEAFPPGSEIRLRSFGDLAAQAIANEQAQAEMRASRARIVRAADEARQKLERNLHDGAQQRLVAVSLSLRMATGQLPGAPERAHELLTAASEELTQAIDELRELARGIHPSVLTERGLGPALELLAKRAPLKVKVVNDLGDERLPSSVEAGAYYVVAESLTNVAKYADASSVQVHVGCVDGSVRVEVVDDGVGGADAALGSGLRGLADRVEALDGRFGVESAPGEGTRVWAEIPLESDALADEAAAPASLEHSRY
jgi:signal transduction histidine kinase